VAPSKVVPTSAVGELTDGAIGACWLAPTGMAAGAGGVAVVVPAGEVTGDCVDG
jgi:hypothetical protein